MHGLEQDPGLSPLHSKTLFQKGTRAHTHACTHARTLKEKATV